MEFSLRIFYFQMLLDVILSLVNRSDKSEKLVLFSYLIMTVLALSLHLCKLYASLVHGWLCDVCTLGKEQMVGFSFLICFNILAEFQEGTSWEEMYVLSCS